MSIALYSFPGVPASLPARLAQPLREVFRLPVHLVAASTLALPPRAWYPDREQFLAARLLSEVAAAPPPPDAPPHLSVRLGIAAHDLFATGLNFVFGEASSKQRCAVFSISRLDDAFYGLRQSTPEAFLRRCATEAVHELGHVFGLAHCRNARCVMFFSNTLDDTDAKGYHLCADCQRRLAARLQAAAGG